MDYQDYLQVLEARLLDLDEQAESQTMANRRYYALPEYKRSYARAREGWQDIKAIASTTSSPLGRLYRQVEAFEEIERAVLARLYLPKGEKLRAMLGTDGTLTIMVRSASLAHRLRFSLYAVKSELEQALARPISKLEVKIKPDLV